MKRTNQLRHYILCNFSIEEYPSCRTIDFEKHPPKADYRTLRLTTYLTPKIAPPPAAYSALTAGVYPKLKTTDPTALFPMDGNDRLGDCTIAALAHAETVYHGLVGTNQIMAQQDVIKLYMHLAGGVDSGLNELDVLSYWRKNPVSEDRIITFVKTHPKNHARVQLAINLFGDVYLGFQGPQNCMQEFEAHQPWTAGPLTNDGHAVCAVAYDPTGLTVLTWGDHTAGHLGLVG